MLAWVAVSMLRLGGKVRFFCEDETRLGLKTLGGHKITAKGVKPKGQVQWQFKATYFYGIVEPQIGESFFYEFTHLNTDCFQVFLNLVSDQFTDDVLIIQLDNGGFHKAKRLQVPQNIILLFQPPHCPESNPPIASVAISETPLGLDLAKEFRTVAPTAQRKPGRTHPRHHRFHYW